MKTWEVFKIALEKPEVKLERIRCKNDIYIVRDNFIEPIDKRSNYLTIKVDEEWDLMREPVDFMTAISSGKNIKYESWDTYDTVSSALYILSDKILSTAVRMIKGKWYIE